MKWFIFLAILVGVATIVYTLAMDDNADTTSGAESNSTSTRSTLPLDDNNSTSSIATSTAENSTALPDESTTASSGTTGGNTTQTQTQPPTVSTSPIVKKYTMVELLTEHGYSSETHEVTTHDNYILKVYRIPYGKNCKEKRGKLPVLLQHGLLTNSIDFIISGPESGLGFLLADKCYDVWISNSRGNFESKKHVIMTPDNEEFWDFSWHSMGKYDTPDVIDYILKTTGKKQIDYIGHSQGCTQFFVYASLEPVASRQKVRSMHALAPMAFMDNMKNPLIKWVADHLSDLELIYRTLGRKDLSQPPDWMREIMQHMCADVNSKICSNDLFLLCGPDSKVDEPLLGNIVANDPAGASVRQLIHYAQSFQSKDFLQYDYGGPINMAKYLSWTPPRYEIEKIGVPLHLYYGEKDWLASLPDVQRFAMKVPNSKIYKLTPEYNHLDFLWAANVKAELYDIIISTLDNEL